ncbi:MAG: hypothetical protein ACKVU4_03035 [Phycisphaerales bacterium]
MPLLRRSPVSRLDERMCLGCGYRGPELQGPRGLTEVWCPECGEDLYSRPPRSYSELEGFAEAEEPLWGDDMLLPESPIAPVTFLRRVFARAVCALSRWF